MGYGDKKRSKLNPCKLVKLHERLCGDGGCL